MPVSIERKANSEKRNGISRHGGSNIIRELVRAYALPPYDIDNGVCDYFASDLVLALEAIGKASETYWTPEEEELPGHCWVKVDGRFYDAETPFGVADWRELLIFKDASQRL